MPRASAADAAETARRILAEATAHFATHGYASASVDEIATAASVTRGAVYHHYRSKAVLFAAVVSDRQHRIAATIAEATAHIEGADALRAGSHAFLDAITTGPAARILLVDAPAVLSWDAWRQTDAAGPETELRAGLRDAGIAEDSLPAVTAALSGAMNELAAWIARSGTASSERAAAHRTLDRFLDAFLTQEAEF